MAKKFLPAFLALLLTSCASLAPNPDTQWREFSPAYNLGWTEIDNGWRSTSSKDTFLWSRPLLSDEVELDFSWRGEGLYIVLAGDANKANWHRGTSIIHLSERFAAVRKDSIFNDGKYVEFETLPAREPGADPTQQVHIVARQAMLQLTIDGRVLPIMALPYAVGENSTVGFARYGLNDNVTLLAPLFGYWPND